MYPAAPPWNGGSPSTGAVRAGARRSRTADSASPDCSTTPAAVSTLVWPPRVRTTATGSAITNE
jgi:hypothetical protein